MPPERTGLVHSRSSLCRLGSWRGLLLAGLALVLPARGQCVARGAEAPKTSFDLPPGEAATTLKRFSRQSGEEIIFLVDQVRPLKTKGVTGKLTPREALVRRLEGSGFSAVQDEKSGAFAIRRNPASTAAPGGDRPVLAADRVVMLPPIFVEESQFPPPRWRYVKLRGMEFLSCCDDATTGELVERVYHLNQRLAAFLPAEFRLRLSAPITFVLYGETQHPVDFKEMIAALQHPAGEAAALEAMTIRYLPNFRLSARDEMAVFYIPGSNFTGIGYIHLDEGFIRSAMAGRTPPLPPWFVEGMMALYQNSSLEDEDLYAAKFPFGSAQISLPNELFGSETKRLFDADPNWKTKLLPVAELFSSPPPGNNAGPDPNRNPAGDTAKDIRYARWWSQSALFVHWALSNGDDQSRAALWIFAQRAGEQPVTEAMFKEFFGLGYAEMDRRLADYLPKAVRAPIRVYSDVVPELQPFSLRMATDAETSRIKGNVERLEVPYVRSKYPALTSKYLDQARRTLRRAYDRGARDPGLLEVMGLCECDAGDDASARPFLEAAARSGAVRPRAYYELARIRLQALRAGRSRDATSARPNRRPAGIAVQGAGPVATCAGSLRTHRRGVATKRRAPPARKPRRARRGHGLAFRPI